MWRIGRAFGLVATACAFALSSLAQYETIEIARPFSAHRLAGIVVDPSGAPVKGAVVEECDATFSLVHSTTTADADGYFAFPDAKIGSTFHLQAKSLGFDPMRITVKLRRFARAELRIELVIAT
jgi:hypothetical protein